MARIFTHPPSKQYDAGWDAIFGPKVAQRKVTEEAQELGAYDERCSACSGVIGSKKFNEACICAFPKSKASAPNELESKEDSPEPETKESELTEEELKLLEQGKPLPGGGIRLPRRPARP